MTPASPATAVRARPPRTWQRLVVVEALQLPFLALVIWGRWPVSLWLGAGVASLICCAGTDSGWRWRNRLLVSQAVLWLVAALVMGT